VDCDAGLAIGFACQTDNLSFAKQRRRKGPRNTPFAFDPINRASMERPIALGITLIATDGTDVSRRVRCPLFSQKLPAAHAYSAKAHGRSQRGRDRLSATTRPHRHSDAPPAQRICGIEWGLVPAPGIRACPAAIRRREWRQEVLVPVNRIDNVYGDRNLLCTCPPMKSYSEAPI